MSELGNPEGKKLFKIPVEWKVYDHIVVQANTIEEAVQWVWDHDAEIGLGTTPEYLDDSWQIAADGDTVAQVVDDLDYEEWDA